ncbi:MAG: DUF5752 family protein [Nanoarchaeota archaeon]
MVIKNLVFDCEEECGFKLANGGILRNLNDLNGSLDEMDEGVFRHHVTDEKNDFGNWVREVLGDEKLADDLAIAKNKNMAQVAVLKRMIELVKDIIK